MGVCLIPDVQLRFYALQAGVSRSGGSFGVNSALLELDSEANDRCSTERHLCSQACDLIVVSHEHKKQGTKAVTALRSVCWTTVQTLSVWRMQTRD